MQTRSYYEYFEVSMGWTNTNHYLYCTRAEVVDEVLAELRKNFRYRVGRVSEIGGRGYRLEEVSSEQSEEMVHDTIQHLCYAGWEPLSRSMHVSSGSTDAITWSFRLKVTRQERYTRGHSPQSSS